MAETPWAADILPGRIVRMEPLAEHHLPDLLARAEEDVSIFRWIAGMDTPDGRRKWLETGLEEARRGVSVPFATVLQATGRAVGTTRFSALVWDHRRAEIGWTWLARSAQRTGANREAKLLMLRHAFEVWMLRRVEFKTDSRNIQSRTALAALGAVEEGTFRAHMILPDGSRRDSTYFSILPDEFPAIAARIEAALPAV